MAGWKMGEVLAALLMGSLRSQAAITFWAGVGRLVLTNTG